MSRQQIDTLFIFLQWLVDYFYLFRKQNTMISKKYDKNVAFFSWNTENKLIEILIARSRMISFSMQVHFSAFNLDLQLDISHFFDWTHLNDCDELTNPKLYASKLRCIKKFLLYSRASNVA